jgi:hypothetical protein
MQVEVRERISTLLKEATEEQDPRKFREVVHEINLLLQQKQDRLDRAQTLIEQRPEG